MKFFNIFALVALLAVANAAKTCVKVTTTPYFSESTDGCKPGQVRKSIDEYISVPPVEANIRVTMKCFKPKRAGRVQKRIGKCIKTFMKRCRCVEDAWKLQCINDRINDCAPQATKTNLH